MIRVDDSSKYRVLYAKGLCQFNVMTLLIIKKTPLPHTISSIIITSKSVQTSQSKIRSLLFRNDTWKIDAFDEKEKQPLTQTGHI